MELFDLFAAGLKNYRAETATLPLGVYVWMWFMRAVLIGGGLVFIGTVQGRVIFAMMAVNIAVLWGGKGLWPDMPLSMLGTSAHVVLWAPVLVWLVLYLRRTGQPVGGAYTRMAWRWGWLAGAVMAASLLMDAVTLLR